MATDIKRDIQPNVLSDVLLAEYVLKKEDNERFKLDSRWNSSQCFYDFVVLYKIALVLIVLLNIERKNENFFQVRLNFEKAIFTDGNIQKLYFYYEVKSAMDKLGELIDHRNHKLDNLNDQNSKLPWTMACLRAAGVLGNDQPMLHSVIPEGWAMAWLREAGIIETNPARLFQFALMWMDNYITINDYVNEYNPKDGSMSELPVNWEQTLRKCNFFMARRGIADVFRLGNQQAEAEGKQCIWKKEIAEAWDQFSANPCYDTAVRFVMVSPPLLPYFDGSVQKSLYPAIWTATTFSLEDYRLPNKTTDIKELRELSQQEYVFFPRQFEGEVIYNATPIKFIGRQWKFMVSSVHGKIYKWAASLEVGRDEDFDSIGNKVIEYCIRWLGAPTQEEQGYLFWDTSDGNVILQLTNMTDWFDISIFVTSRKIRSLKKL